MVNYHRQENGLMYYGILDVMDLKLENIIFNCDCLDTMDVWKMIKKVKLQPFVFKNALNLCFLNGPKIFF